MNEIDTRGFSDRQLLAYLALGGLPRPGWPGRRRVIAYRALQLVAVALAVLVGLAAARLVILVLWAASL